jgi:hypothetical protein
MSTKFNKRNGNETPNTKIGRKSAGLLAADALGLGSNISFDRQATGTLHLTIEKLTRLDITRLN